MKKIILILIGLNLKAIDFKELAESAKEKVKQKVEAISPSELGKKISRKAGKTTLKVGKLVTTQEELMKLASLAKAQDIQTMQDAKSRVAAELSLEIPLSKLKITSSAQVAKNAKDAYLQARIAQMNNLASYQRVKNLLNEVSTFKNAPKNMQVLINQMTAKPILADLDSAIALQQKIITNEGRLTYQQALSDQIRQLGIDHAASKDILNRYVKAGTSAEEKYARLNQMIAEQKAAVAQQKAEIANQLPDPTFIAQLKAFHEQLATAAAANH